MVLSKFDQQSVPDLPLKVTLNTMLSFLVTLAKAAFMFPRLNSHQPGAMELVSPGETSPRLPCL